MPETYVALLRGVNVGGKNVVPMAALAEVFVAEGCADVRTYIQSGNVVFRAGADRAAHLAGRVTAAITERFGCATPVVLRTAAEMRAVVAGNPFLDAGQPADALHVLFLAAAPAPGRVAALDPGRSPPDRFAVRGAEVYLSLPNGAGRTKLTNAYFDAKLATIGTGRNWRTVTALAGMIGAT